MGTKPTLTEHVTSIIEGAVQAGPSSPGELTMCAERIVSDVAGQFAAYLEMLAGVQAELAEQVLGDSTVHTHAAQILSGAAGSTRWATEVKA